MSEAIITVENLGKCYRLQHQQERQRYVALRDVITSKVKGLFGNRQPAVGGRQSEEDFWALKDVSFEIKQGEVVGIIGRNGAGKSTLLKILSRITEPSSGRIRIGGRVASLLEVGTGFHPELTGRENIFLNGAILGMTRAEIRGKFDEIVAFAEVEKFLDTPVKRYSSGMYVRLAFAVAAHLEPEILIVDEVLAVGDVAFQKKCLGKMQDVSRHQGRTVLFVSHNMAAVKALCRKGILLEQGRVERCGPVDEIVERYLCGGESGVHSGVIPDALPRQFATGEARLRRVQMVDGSGQPVQFVLTGEALSIRIEWEVIRPLASALIEIGVMDSDGRQVTQSCSNDGGGVPAVMEAGWHEIRLRIDESFFPGRYSLLAGLHKEDGTTVDFVERALDFEVLNTGKGEPNHYRWSVRGYLRPQQEWQGPFRQNNPPLATTQSHNTP
jgi:lipopolysaccharide transport system ATP-binding protein